MTALLLLSHDFFPPQDSGPPLLTVTSPYSTTPRVHPSPPHSSPPPRSQSLSPRRTNYASSFSSPHSSYSLSPRTYTVSSNPRPLVHSPQPPTQTQTENATQHSGTLPPYPAEPLPTTGDQQTNREERIHALTQSALELKKRIAAEAERLKQSRKAAPDHPSGSLSATSPPRTARTLRTHSYPTSSHRITTGGHNGGISLPGVQSVHRHALLAEKVRREGEAAATIQAAFRGYRVRKSLHWQLPSGRTLGGLLGGSARVGDGEEDGSTGVNGILKTSTPHQSSVAVQTSTTMVYPLTLKSATANSTCGLSTTVTPATAISTHGPVTSPAEQVSQVCSDVVW